MKQSPTNEEIASPSARNDMTLFPIHGYFQFAAQLGIVINKPIVPAKLIDTACDVHVGFAVLGDLVQLAISEPFNRLQSIGGLGRSQSCLRDRVQAQAKVQCPIDILQHVCRAECAEVFVSGIRS